MRKRPVLNLVIGLALASGISTAAAETRLFTDSHGRQLQAELLNFDGTTARLRERNGRIHDLGKSAFSLPDQSYLESWRLKKAGMQVALDERVKPGASFMLEFPDLPETADGKPAACEVHIPSNFNYPEPVPTLFWMSGGKGSRNVSSANGVVDFERFIVVALPFPKSVPSVKKAVEDRKVDDVWEFQKSMVASVKELVPNIDPDVILVGGSSNGAHAIGSGLDQKWDGFCDYFSGFILHEGGSSPGGRYAGARGKRILLVSGGKSPHTDYQRGLEKQFHDVRPKLTIEVVPGEGHELGEQGRARIKSWIEEQFFGAPPTR